MSSDEFDKILGTPQAHGRPAPRRLRGEGCRVFLLRGKFADCIDTAIFLQTLGYTDIQVKLFVTAAVSWTEQRDATSSANEAT